MTRQIRLVVYHSCLFAAHWSFFVPSIRDANVGSRLHVTGDVRSGFQHAISRNYDLRQTARSHTTYLLADIDDQYVEDYPSVEDIPEAPVEPVCKLEEVVFSIPAPGPSLRRSSSGANVARVQQLNCQDWIKECVDVLVSQGIFPNSAVDALKNAPRN
ncbi:hypothetical protein GLOTRDRAFT_37345 [Gloeophyllum trabeum ATCC 11539]|uniref:Uncharacterized protein n=1 Tax=Gloeophyllum trabeum (strain ATCC 11539 / FP-39264 / Madison 617) TaxID=670483 RepID=S7QH72_GLOTA|nr:uncharacterized protein GLOTRDRAFT_37345 [Gloeophyllum trabeum ATCC 11539]EPQ58603.1 hypothetical protein GLOTRDRAFT_37345 [Gloeophyllum trabeum ATCC 11539]